MSPRPLLHPLPVLLAALAVSTLGPWWRAPPQAEECLSATPEYPGGAAVPADMKKTTTVAAAVALCTAAGCDLCGPEIVQVGAMPGTVRLRNSCPSEVGLGETRLRFGLSYAQSVLTPAGSLPAGWCRTDGVLGLPHSVPTAFGVGLFGPTDDVLTAAPKSAVIWGAKNTKLRNELGQIGLVDAAAIEAGTTLTRGSAGWYTVPSQSGVPCDTWGQVIEASADLCEPRLVEVHPGASTAFAKVALPAWCAPVELNGYAISWGRAPVDHVYQLSGTLAGGDQLVVGVPVTAAENGWPQWGWPGFTAAPELQPIAAAHAGLAFAVLMHQGKPVQGVAYGPATTPHPILQEFPGGVPGGMSLRWRGPAWELGPASPNQAPTWTPI